MNYEIVRSNKYEVETSLKKTFEKAKTVDYRIDNLSLKGVAKYPNRWYDYCGAIESGECLLAIFVLALMYGILGALDFLAITNIVWTWIVFVIISILSTFVTFAIIETTRYSQEIVVIGLSVIVALITLLLYWQVQKANPQIPQTIHLDFLFKFHFSKP